MISHVLAGEAPMRSSKGIWRNGSASDSRSEGWEFESLCPHLCPNYEEAGSTPSFKSPGLSSDSMAAPATRLCPTCYPHLDNKCRHDMTAVGFEPTQLALVELESTPLDHSGKLSLLLCIYKNRAPIQPAENSVGRPHALRDLAACHGHTRPHSKTLCPSG